MSKSKNNLPGQDYGPIIGPHDPLVIKLGLVNNPVLVKDIRLFTHHVRNLKPYVRVVYCILFALPFIVAGTLVALGVSGVADSLSINIPFYGVRQIDSKIAILQNVFYLLSYDRLTIIFSAIALALIVLLLFLLPGHFMFYGYDNSDEQFSVLKLTRAGARTILWAKIFNQVPLFFALYIPCIAWLYGELIIYLSGGWDSAVDIVTGSYDKTMIYEMILIATISALAYYLLIVYYLSFMTHVRIRMMLLIILCSILIVMNNYISEIQAGYIHNDTVSFVNSFIISFSPTSIKELFFHTRALFFSGVSNASSGTGLIDDSISTCHMKLILPLFFQFLWSGLAMYGIHSNVKRKLDYRSACS